VIWFPCQNAKTKNIRRQAGNVERIFQRRSTEKRKATDQTGQHSGCWSEARTPSDAATKSPPNGARWRRGSQAREAGSYTSNIYFGCYLISIHFYLMLRAVPGVSQIKTFLAWRGCGDGNPHGSDREAISAVPNGPFRVYSGRGK
jgi:hypothetical protein